MLWEKYLERQISRLPQPWPDSFDIPERIVRLANLDCLVYTTTDFFQQGKPIMVQFFAIQDQTLATKERVLQISASLATRSRDTVLQAVVQAAVDAGLPIREVEADQLASGGVTDRLDRTWYILGDEPTMLAEGIELGVSSRAIMQQLEVEGKRMRFLAQRQPKRLLAIFAFDKEIPPSIISGVKRLSDLGLEQIILTSEKTRVAKGIASRLRIELLHTELQASQKRHIIEELTGKRHRCGVVYSPTTLKLGSDESGLPILIAGNGRRFTGVSLSSIADLPEGIEEARKIVKRAGRLFFWRRFE
ncbi:HAD family hydrolase [Patescibacteria group bacterium]|nr:HAD family hydrolase [Patescibacteria group bacterium]